MNSTVSVAAVLLASGLNAAALAQTGDTVGDNAASPAAGLTGSPSVELSAIFNPSWQSRAQALLHRDRGPGLGHNEVRLAAALSPGLEARVSAVAHSDHHKIESDVEEAFLEAPSLPGGVQARAGRFLSQLGYLNELHPHADDFVMRPLLHRAFLGGHYYDNGLRLNWVAPAPFYWRLGSELMRGKRLPSIASSSGSGAWTLSSRIGDDIGDGTSWQFGLSTLRHRADAVGAAGETDHALEAVPSGAAAAEAAHVSSHGSVFFGRRIDMIDAVWKWAPGGNSRSRQLRLSAELARVGGFGDAFDPGLRHTAWYLSAVYRFLPQWEAGLRFDRLNALALHPDGYQPARLDERSLSLAWKPDHQTAVRLQFTGQRDRGGFAEASELKPSNAIHLQLVKSFGAHGAHAY